MKPISLGCDTGIKLDPDVSKILNNLTKPRSVKMKDDWSVTVSKKSTKDIPKEVPQQIRSVTVSKKSTKDIPKEVPQQIRSVTVSKKSTKDIPKEVPQQISIRSLKTERKDIHKHLKNISNILLYSNATPIRSHTGMGYSCGFCPEHFPLPKDLKTHTLEKHDDTVKSKFKKGCYLTNYVVKIDITALKCQVCGQDIEGLESLIDHLQTIHNKTMHTDIKNHILPFKFEGDTLNCVMCPKSFDRFKLLQEHMNMHYRNYNCTICSSHFVMYSSLRCHIRYTHKQGEFPCKLCTKIFDTESKKQLHEKFVHLGKKILNKCPHCSEKFSNVVHKTEHMVKVHGAKPRVLKCMACDKTFNRRDRLTRHTRRDHLLERKFQCEHCDKSFYGKKGLTMHMLKHTGIKKYTCDFCKKSFGRRHTLKEHLRIHADDRRFKCGHCEQAFVQKCSWKNHMRSKHEWVD